MNRGGELLRKVGKVALIVVIVLSGAWGALALGYRAPGSSAVRAALAGIWVLLVLGFVVLAWRGRIGPALFGFVLAQGFLLLWWNQLAPSNDRIWAADVARTLTASVDGDHVVLHNLRNFDWRSETDFSERWETREYHLDRLDAVDVILSYWDAGPAIAHMIVSFGFDDGEHVAFSVEIRRERGEAFSELGGFFKEFELSVIAADERDVVRVRTNIRGEDDYLYRVQLSEADRRSLFLAYLAEANALAAAPRFYNTITANCTTLVFHMMTRIVGHLPLDYRLLLTGYLPEYLYARGALNSRFSLQQLRESARITEQARQADTAADFSAAIRRDLLR